MPGYRKLTPAYLGIYRPESFCESIAVRSVKRFKFTGIIQVFPDCLTDFAALIGGSMIVHLLSVLFVGKGIKVL
jgi:hypothetical protein